jgi:dihydroneopterin aldolase
MEGIKYLIAKNSKNEEEKKLNYLVNYKEFSEYLTKKITENIKNFVIEKINETILELKKEIIIIINNKREIKKFLHKY